MNGQSGVDEPIVGSYLASERYQHRHKVRVERRAD